MAVRRRSASPLSSTGRRSTVSTKMGISAIAIISAAPTNRLTREVALNGRRLKSERSTTGQRTLRSTSTKAIRKMIARPSEIGLFCGAGAFGSVGPMSVPCWARPRLRQVNAKPSRTAPIQSMPSWRCVPLGISIQTPTISPMTMGTLRKKIYCQPNCCTMIAP